MKNKVELVLEELIKEYLKELTPISSTKLKKNANLPFSASSIRNYLQKLRKNGLIQKEYLSSGSKPTIKALRAFWIKNFKNINIDFDNIEQKIIENNLYFASKMFENELLNKVYQYDKFIILEFKNTEFIFRYDENLFNFLKSLEKNDFNQIVKYLKHLKLTKILKKFDSNYEYLCYNQQRLFDFTKVIDISHIIEFDFDNLKIGLNFIDKVLIYKNLKKIDNKLIEYIIIGDIYSNFFNLTKGGVSGKTQ